MPGASTAVAVRDNFEIVKKDLEEKADEFATALRGQVDPGRFIQIGLRAFAKSPDLLTGTRRSIMTAFFDAAALNLEPVLGRVYFVKFGNEVTLIVGYAGLIELARRSGEVATIFARVVYEGDEYSVIQGSHDQRIVHVPKFLTSDPTKIEHAYAVVQYKDGTIDFEAMPRVEIEKIRARSRSGNRGPWITDTAEMYKKTPLRRLAKRMPLTVEAMEAIEKDDEREFGRQVANGESKTAAVRAQLAAKLGKPVPPGEANPISPDDAPSESADEQNIEEGDYEDLSAQLDADGVV